MNKYQVGLVVVEFPDRYETESVRSFGDNYGGEVERVLKNHTNTPIGLTVSAYTPLDTNFTKSVTHKMSVEETMQVIACLQRAVNEYTDCVVYTSIEVSSISWD